ncbi:hypothetical protein H5410_047708 [Solanum commersonii]|uniref:Uncharacterized protein n=1 Tax=Solanum commersonii TaxID=4109 RepID=A0A9J5XHW7_SOLCO|nr:hypothetical protein H5410_047708 [Solanum commersonii]
MRGTRSDNSIEDDTKYVALMAMEDSKSDIEKREVNLLDLKNKLQCFSKKKLSSFVLTLIDNFQELNENRDQLLTSLTSLKVEYIDLEKINSDLKKENQFLKEQVQQLDSCTLTLKSKILKQNVTENGKEKTSGDQIKCDQDLMRLKNELSSEREKSRRINLDLARTKYELERANKWTQSSMIMTQLCNRTHNTKVGISFVKEGKSLLGVSKITEEVLEDVPCEGEYFGDFTVEQSLVVRLNLDASSEGESMGDPYVEPIPRLGNELGEHVPLQTMLTKFVPLTDSIEIKDDSIEIRVVNFGKRTVLLCKVITDFGG